MAINARERPFRAKLHSEHHPQISFPSVMNQKREKPEHRINGQYHPCHWMTQTERQIRKEAPQEHMNGAQPDPPDPITEDFQAGIPTSEKDQIEPSSDGEECQYTQYS